jgi:hypothetical protein
MGTFHSAWNAPGRRIPTLNRRRAEVKSKSILDPQFRYVPAIETDVAATWRRFGFDPRWNAERRARSLPPRTARDDTGSEEAYAGYVISRSSVMS